MKSHKNKEQFVRLRTKKYVLHDASVLALLKTINTLLSCSGADIVKRNYSLVTSRDEYRS